MSDDVAPVVARIANRITSVANIGLVHTHDFWDRKDLRPFLVSNIGGVDVLRTWWISGPVMEGAPATQGSAGGWQHRWWTYTIHGLEGLTPGGDDLLTLRANALAVSDALDRDPTLANTCQRSWPCEWREKPEHQSLIGVGAVSAVEIAKRVLTLSQP